MSAAARLSQDDITRLMGDRSAAAQMDVAAKITTHYASTGTEAMSGSQSGIAEDIFRLLLDRAEVQVRALIALNLKQSSKLPAEIARQMAADVSEVAAPILEHSEVLTDDDLLGLIREAGDAEKLQAIARRKTVSENISDALVETRIEQVVSTLVSNEGAQIAENTYGKIVERHASSAPVMEAMLQREAVPVAVVEQVIDRLSGALRQNLEKKYGNLVELKELRRALDQSLEVTGLRMLGLKTTDQQLMRLLRHLESSGKLTPFSALAMGNLQLFAVSLSRILRIPLKNVIALLRDRGGFSAAYARAELPESMEEAVYLAVRAITDLEQEGSKGGQKPVISPLQVMERMRMMVAEEPVPNTDYLFAMMQHQLRDNLKAGLGE